MLFTTKGYFCHFGRIKMCLDLMQKRIAWKMDACLRLYIYPFFSLTLLCNRQVFLFV